MCECAIHTTVKKLDWFGGEKYRLAHLFILLTFSITISFAQSIDNYSSVHNGNWNITSIWKIWDGNGWIISTWYIIENTINPGSISKGATNQGPGCAPLDPNTAKSTVDATGSGTITYLWEQSTDNQASWQTAAGSTSTSFRTFNPDEMNVTTSLRRVATFTLNGISSIVCSNVLTYIVYPLPIVASILPGGPIPDVCVNSQITLTNSTPGGAWSTNNALIATVSGGVVTGAGAGTVTISYTVTDGNNCSKTANRTVHANSLPVLTTGSSIYIGNTMNLSPSAGGIWVSNVPSIATVTTNGLVTGLAFGSVTFTFTDLISGCSSTTSSVAVNPLSCSFSPDAPVVNGTSTIYSAPVGMDSYLWSVTGNGSIPYSTTNQQTVTVLAGNNCNTYTVNLAISKNGANSSCQQTITVIDNTAPTWSTATTALNTLVECSDLAGLTSSQSLAPVATDNCGSVTYTKTSGSFEAGSCRATGTYTNTWVAIDECLNTSAVYTQVITLTDNSAPTWITLAGSLNKSVEFGDATGLAAAQALIPIAIDNCDTYITNIIKISGVFVPGNNPNEGTYTNTWTGKDACGNISTIFTQVIKIKDNTSPIITCPANVTIDCEDNNSPAGTGRATATDNYAPAGNITISFSDVSTYKTDPANVLHYNYTIIRKWRATDVAGNFSECTQIITIHDVIAPAITCPANVTIDCEDNNSPAGTGRATATDNYAPAGNITISFSDVSTYKTDPANVLHYNYTITRKWRATDVAGNFSECTQIITIHDVIAPAITCPTNITIDCEDNNTPASTGKATATDNYAPAGNITITFSDVSTYKTDPANVLHYNYTIYREWRATDVAGNFSDCTQTITVHDITAPSYTVPPAITICRASDCSYNIDPYITGDVIDESDNCTPGTLLKITYTDDLSGLINCNNSGFIVRKWTLTDISGNTSVKVQTIRVEPIPQVELSTKAHMICNDDTTGIMLSSPNTFTSGVIKFKFTATAPEGLVGFTASAKNLQNGFTIADNLINSTDVPLTVTYIIIPVSPAGCNDGPSKIVTVTVNPILTITSTSSVSKDGSYNINCNSLSNGSIMINPSGGLAPFVYSWTGPDGFSATTKNISDLKAGQYNLLITDSIYCTAEQTINLTEPGKLGMTFTLSSSTAGGFNINCTGDSTGYIDIKPTNHVGSVDYLWSDGVFGKTRNNLSAGDYSIIITDENNCQASSTTTLTEPDSMKLIFDISQPFCPDKPDGEIRINVTGGVSGTDYSYKWSDNSTNSKLSEILKGFYKISVIDMNGCSIKDSVIVEPLKETCLSIPDAISPNSDLINDVWNIGLIELYPGSEIKIFNRWGEIIWRSEKGYPQPWDGKRNGSSLPIDSYHYIIDLKNGSKPIIGNVTIVR
jgi:gliding motility-associated-like protein